LTGGAQVTVDGSGDEIDLDGDGINLTLNGNDDVFAAGSTNDSS